MANCSEPINWTVLPTGHGTGSVTCGAYRGWYARNAHGLIQISWSEPGDTPAPEVGRAAREACEKADSGQQTSKAGRIDAGG
jgi:hypothetical protein